MSKRCVSDFVDTRVRVRVRVGIDRRVLTGRPQSRSRARPVETAPASVPLHMLLYAGSGGQFYPRGRREVASYF